MIRTVENQQKRKAFRIISHILMSILICYIPNVVAYFMLIAEIISNLYTCIAFPLILSITMIFELILPLIRIYSEGHLKQALKYRLNM